MPHTVHPRTQAVLSAWILILSACASAPTPDAASTQATGAAVALSPAARPVQPTSGALVIVGGGGSTPAIWDRFMELAGGDSAVIVYFPTASATADAPPDSGNNDALRVWRARNPKSAVLMHTRSRDTANTDAFVEPLRRATGVWFGGGDQSRITDSYLGTKTEEALRDVLRRGGVVGGTSAGAAIMSEIMITGNERMADSTAPMTASLGTGFGFLGSAVADQHFTQRRRQPRLVGVLRKHPGLVGFGIDEATALIVHGSRGLEVLGRGRVNFMRVMPGAAVDSTLWTQAPAVTAAAAADSATRASGRRASPPKVLQGDLVEITREVQARTRARAGAAAPRDRDLEPSLR